MGNNQKYYDGELPPWDASLIPPWPDLGPMPVWRPDAETIAQGEANARAARALKLSFGKHAGATIEEVIRRDRGYAHWLGQSGWFAVKHPAMCERLELAGIAVLWR
jgi:hypothetical protein